MPNRPAPGEVLGYCNKAWPLMPYYIVKALVLLAIHRHPSQRGNH